MPTVKPTPSKTPPSGLAPHQVQFVLTLLLIMAAFAVGVLWTKVQFYEKGTSAGSPSKTTTTTQPAKAAAKAPQITSEDHIRGNKNAKVTLVEYSDFECPFCKQFHPTMKKVLDTYGDDVRWVYRHFPLSFHINAQKEAEASECAAELGGEDAFWEYTDKIFERTTSNGTGFALNKLAPLAKELGLDEAKFQTCLDSGTYTKKVIDQMAKGTEEGVSGTPGTIIINAKGETQLIPGALPFDQVKSMVDQALKST